MPTNVLARRRTPIARLAVLALIAGLLVVGAVPASAAISTATSCPSTIPNAPFTDLGGLDATTVDAIDCLVFYGITQGTSATTFNPTGTVARWQMALFLTRQAVDHGVALPSGASQGFTDIGALDAATQTAINQLKQLGVTAGTSATTFDPNGFVPRWQMALFLTRLATGAGVTLGSGASQGFTDIGTLDAATQTAINQAKQLGIADGTSTTTFDPLSNTLRWQMALFLTRLLAADGVTAAGLQVTVTPTDTVTLSPGNGRAFTATFKNADGTPYTGAVGITLKAVTSGVIQYDSTPVPTALFESQSDGLAVVGAALTPTIEGFPGTNGIVTFVLRDVAGPTETIVAVAWEDLNNDNDPEISGNSAPTEPFGNGGNTTFATGALAECTAVTGSGTFAVTAVDKANDRFEMNGCSIFYDSNDLLKVSGVGSALADFEAALNVGDDVTATYDPDAADQSTIDISTDNDPAVTVTDPAAATSTTAASYLVKGTAVAGYTVRIYADIDNDLVLDPGEGVVASGLAAGDGTWSLSVPLTTAVDNNFMVTQRPLPGDADQVPYVDVPTITQGTAAGVTFVTTSSADVAGTPGVLTPGDTIAIDFSGTGVTGVGSGDTLTILDVDGSTATITCGTNATCTPTAGDLDIVITNVLITSGGTGGIQTAATFTAVSGFTSVNGAPVNVTSGDRTFEL